MNKRIILTEAQVKKAFQSVIKEYNENTSPKNEALRFLHSMNSDLQRASSGNFAHLAANLRGSIIYLIELITNEWNETHL